MEIFNSFQELQGAGSAPCNAVPVIRNVNRREAETLITEANDAHNTWKKAMIQKQAVRDKMNAAMDDENYANLDKETRDRFFSAKTRLGTIAMDSYSD